MTIIEKWREMTTCKDCCKRGDIIGSLGTENPTFACEDPSVCNTWATSRCDNGLWLFKDAEHPEPHDLFTFLCSTVGMGPIRWIQELIPREEWPEVSDD